MKKEPKIFTVGPIDLSLGDTFSAPDIHSLPVIPTRNLVLFPGVTIPIALVRETSFKVAAEAHDKNVTIGLCCQINPEKDNPTCAADLMPYGVFIEVLQIFKLPDDTNSALIRATGRFKVKGDASASAQTPCLEVSRVNDSASDPRGELPMLAKIITSNYLELLKLADAERPGSVNPDGGDTPTVVINTIATHLQVPQEDKMKLLSKSKILSRGEMLLSLIHGEMQRMSMAREIMDRAREELSQEQREMFIRRQMDIMQKELYGAEDETEQLRKKADEKRLSGSPREAFDKGLTQLGRIQPSSPDYFVLYNYLTTLLDIPWDNNSILSDSLPEAKKVLDNDHYGLTKVKERIIEQVAVSMANPDGNAPILCLVGAPGVGKTSLGVSIAKALGRKYQRVSLGGVSDESEIRGHRRTYIGAMPGRIIDALRKAGTSNPLLLLDEIDKLSRDIKGDPSAALLEVLDPEQNCHFHDNYVDVDVDLSKVLFIATANSLDTIPRPLLDRMEVVEVPGYLLEEKIEIAQRHLVARVENAVGLPEGSLSFSNDAISAIIEGYTSESGVRQLEKALASIARKLLVARMSEENPSMSIDTAERVKEILGPAKFTPQRYEALGVPGVVTGLAWTPCGGEILFIESSLTEGKGEKLTLTGNLGDVMKESATIALQYVRAHADMLNIPAEKFTTYNLHIHVPEGAVPKDGPSAGITMAVSIASTFTGRMVVPKLALTGEITLRGRVMPVGGIKEKILAARRAGITDIIISKENQRDIDQIEPAYVDSLNFHYVSEVSEVLEIALEPAK